MKKRQRTIRQSLYERWFQMIARCTNPSHPAFSNYGARGVTVCERWKLFKNFRHDMGPAFKLGFSIDRINNDGSYEPSNCRWADRETQNNNTRRNRFIEFNGETMTVGQWSRRIGIKHRTLYIRINRGWPIHEAIGCPVGPSGVGNAQGRARGC